jgi:hypothetical protein
MVAVALVVANSFNAVENIATSTDHRTDHRRSIIEDAQKRSSARSEWSAKVDDARSKVGVTAWSEYNSKVELHKLSDPQKWNATNHCAPEKVTISKAFCLEYERLNGLAKIAWDRDIAQAKVIEIDNADDGKEKIANADPFVATVVAMVGVLGFKSDPHNDLGVRSLKTFQRAGALEAMATFFPMLWLAFVDILIKLATTVAKVAPTIVKPRRSELPAKGEEPKSEPLQGSSTEGNGISAAPPAKPSKCTPEFECYCADELEQGSTFDIKATPAYRLWQDWCLAHNLEAGSQKAFGLMMREKFTKDDKHGYPRYLGVRAKPKPTKFKVVAKNAA